MTPQLNQLVEDLDILLQRNSIQGHSGDGFGYPAQTQPLGDRHPGMFGECPADVSRGNNRPAGRRLAAVVRDRGPRRPQVAKAGA